MSISQTNWLHAYTDAILSTVNLMVDPDDATIARAPAEFITLPDGNGSTVTIKDGSNNTRILTATTLVQSWNVRVRQIISSSGKVVVGTGNVPSGASVSLNTVYPPAMFHKLVDAAASTVLAQVPFFRAPGPRTVAAIYFLPLAALTAHDTTYATLTVTKRDVDGTSLGIVGSFTTKITGGSGDWVAFTPEAFTLGTLYLSLTAGQCLSFDIAKASTGVPVPAGSVQVDFAP